MNWTTAYDRQFATITHFQRYPELYPWVGQEFQARPNKILVLGESHYLNPRSTYHHDAAAWYAGVDIRAADDKTWIMTRNIIANGLASRWKEKSKLIYRNIESAAHEAGVRSSSLDESSFHSLAFMNYFQRPAQVSKQSIVVTELDRQHSAAVVNAVLRVLTPRLVIFCSVQAWKAARNAGVLDQAAHPHVKFEFTPHPATRWWHTKMRKYDDNSGKQMFIQAIGATAP